MRPLSAIDAIAPAWNHTRRLLLTPRSWRLLLKIGAVAFFAQINGCNPRFSTGPHLPNLPHALTAAFFTFAVLISIVACVLALAFFYFGSRLQFVLFEVVLRRDTTVAPIWQRYGRATWHWIGLKLAFFAVALLCVAPVLIPVGLRFYHATRSMNASAAEGASPHLAAFFLSLLGFIGAFFLILLVIGIFYTLLHDFGLPSMALEGTPLPETVRRIVNLVRAEPGQILLYLFMRFVLAFAGAVIFEFALVFGLLIALIPLGGIAGILWVALHHASFVGHAFMITGWVVLGGIFLVLLIVACIMGSGYLYTFLQAYALYFLGGRYPLVGGYLEPLLPRPVYAYPGVPQGYYPPAPSTETQQAAPSEEARREPDPTD